MVGFEVCMGFGRCGRYLTITGLHFSVRFHSDMNRFPPNQSCCHNPMSYRPPRGDIMVIPPPN